jgi:hypothetical protein
MFLKTHGQDIWPVILCRWRSFFQTIHAFVIVQNASRRVVHVGVTARPTDEWITQQLRDVV